MKKMRINIHKEREKFHLKKRGVNFINILCAKICQSQNVTREKLQEPLSYKKFACKMLMKLT